MNGRRALSVVVLSLLATQAGLALAQNPRTAAPAPPPSGPGPAVATVGTATIPQAELDARYQQALTDYRARTSQAVPNEMRALARRQVLEGLIRARLLGLEARRLNALASVSQAESVIKQMPVFSTNGRFDPVKYEAIRTNQPQPFAAALNGVREQLGARRLAAGLEARFAPPEAEARAQATRELRRVTLDHLALPFRDFDGAVPEPREAQVEAYYRAHPADFQRDDRATVSIAFVNVPALPDSLAALPGRREEWTRGMRLAADTLLGAVRGGASFDSAAARFGFRGSIVVARDNFPGYWRGSAAQQDFLFRPEHRGQIVPEPVAATQGWLVVRIDDVTPSHLAPFVEVAREIRATLRRDRRQHLQEDERRALYAQMRDSLSGPGWPIHYAAVDTSAVALTEPTEADLDHWYRAHEADYARFDAQAGAIVTTPFAEVRDDVRRRSMHEQRVTQTRMFAEQLLESWHKPRPDAALEARFHARTTPPLVRGSEIDTGAVAHALGDTIWKVPAPRGGELIATPGGWIAWEALPRIERVTPTFEQAQALIVQRLEARHDAEDLRGARALYEADPSKFRKGDVVRLTRITVPPPLALDVPLTRAEVEEWYRTHLDDYSAAEMVDVKHIFILPADKSSAADRTARNKAEDILRRLKAGEDFTQLASRYSDDPTSRDRGGDLGTITHGMMLEPFEKAAFSTATGELYPSVVKTEVGYHVIKVTDHQPLLVHPLALVYGGVAADAAQSKANLLARNRGDSLYRSIKDPRQLVATARRMGATIEAVNFGLDDPMNNGFARPFLDAVRTTPAGHIVPGAFMVEGVGTWLGVVDSIGPGSVPTWDDARPTAIDRFRRGAGERALQAKRAELDSLLASGMSFDSLGTYWGGLGHSAGLAPTQGLPGVGGGETLDSLLFGGMRGGAALPAGSLADWVTTQDGIAKFRIVSRTEPAAAAVADRVEFARRNAMEQKLVGYFDGLRKRYPVKILDRELRTMSNFGLPATAPPGR